MYGAILWLSAFAGSNPVIHIVGLSFNEALLPFYHLC